MILPSLQLIIKCIIHIVKNGVDKLDKHTFGGLHFNVNMPMVNQHVSHFPSEFGNIYGNFKENVYLIINLLKVWQTELEQISITA